MQAWVSCSWSRTPDCDPHALGGDQCGEQRGPDHKHINNSGCSEDTQLYQKAREHYKYGNEENSINTFSSDI